MSNPSSYTREHGHQVRALLFVLAIMLLFGAGIRFDRAMLVDPSRPTQASSAFAAVVPPPALLPGTAGPAARRNGARASAVGGEAAPGASGDVATTGTGGGVGGPEPGGTIAGTGAGPVTPSASAATALEVGRFGGGSGSLFGIPSGVVFGGGGAGGTPGGGGTPGIVPEPESWAFMILGVAMIGGTMRLRRARRGKAGGLVAVAA